MEVNPTTPYDEVPYPASAYPQSHPARLALVASLFGLTPPDIHRCRVLELGCADGSNLLPMAAALPESQFLGIDLSRVQIAAGCRALEASGLKNVELCHVDILDVDASYGVFDYIIVHGIFSWVPAEVKEKILSICRSNLAPDGVAYVSYNTYPGWRMRGLLRDMMLYHAGKFDEPAQQVEQARALIQWLGASVPVMDNPYGMLLHNELEQMKNWRDTYFRHDSLAETNEPLYFHQFAAMAESHGLQYLGEAEFASMLPENQEQETCATLNRLGRDIIELEQYMDFVRNRMFRQTLLCHREARPSRSLGPWRLEGRYLAAGLEPEKKEFSLAAGAVVEFRGRQGMTVTTGNPLAKAAMVVLKAHWPQAVALQDLSAEVEAMLSAAAVPLPGDPETPVSHRLAELMFNPVCRNSIEAHVSPFSFTTVPGEKPTACPWVRWQAGQGEHVTNRRHERVTLDRFARSLVTLLDGSRDQEEMISALTALASDGTLNVQADGEPVTDPAEIRQVMESILPGKLREMAYLGLLVD